MEQSEGKKIDLRDFEFERVLRNSPEEKGIWLLG
jgi:hypothetical protein